jgi:hypothetical protein
MSLRTLYLATSPSADGHDGVAGRKLHDELRARSEECLLAHRVLPAAMAGEIDARLVRETVSEELVGEFAPNLVFIEGGLFADDRGAWKIDWPVIEDIVDRGGVLIVADCGTPELHRYRSRYEYAARFLRARAQFTTGDVVYAADETNYWQNRKQIVCRPANMLLSPWLRPALEDIQEVVAGNPAQLSSWQHLPASGNLDTAQIVEPRGAGEFARSEPCIFASVAQCGLGHVAFIAAEVSADRWTERFPANTRWLANLAELLHRDAADNLSRSRADLRWPLTLFLSHRSVNRQLVKRAADAVRSRGAEACLDADRLKPTDSLVQEVGRTLDRLTHFVLFWSRACLGAPWVDRELPEVVSMVLERRLPLMVARLDATPLPKTMADAYRLEAIGMSPQELAASLIAAAQRIARNAQ